MQALGVESFSIVGTEEPPRGPVGTDGNTLEDTLTDDDMTTTATSTEKKITLGMTDTERQGSGERRK